MTTHMRREIAEIPQVAQLLAQDAQPELRRIADRLRDHSPSTVLTVARGSSDHAATYLKYVVEVVLGLPVASIGPSIATVYERRLAVSACAGLAISQSGSSRDIVTLAEDLRAGGALMTALTNTPRSPLAETCDETLDIRAGPEKAVAATKSMVQSIITGLWLVAYWAKDDALVSSLSALPDLLCSALETEKWQEASSVLEDSDRCFVIARGAGLGVALEMGLKLIETCQLHATAHSGAEVMHGPSAILTDGFPVIALSSGAGASMEAPVDQLRSHGARVITVPAAPGDVHRLVAPLLDLPGFYLMVEALSRAKGANPDAPAFLHKETNTV